MMHFKFIPCLSSFSISLVLIFGGLSQYSFGQKVDKEPDKKIVAELDKALASVKKGSSAARKRLAIRRVIRDANKLLTKTGDDPKRYVVLELLFRAHQRLIVVDNDSKYRKALVQICEELVKAPDQLAEFRMEADLLLSQAKLAKKGANSETRADALRPFISRYVNTAASAKVLRMGVTMALELGDTRLVNELREMIAEKHSGDLDMINFQRDKLGGQVFGAPFVGTFERSDGKLVRFPMDGIGRSTLLLFWSKEDGGVERIKAIAAAAIARKEDMGGRLEIVSLNLDDLPDAGASLLSDVGVKWQMLKLPGGRENPIFKAYARVEPRNLMVTPTGQTALIMAGTSRKRVSSKGMPDYTRMFQSILARNWTNARYTSQITSLVAGDFFILDPAGGIDPTRPPELKAYTKGKEVKALVRGENSVPEKDLLAIQESFIVPPLRYRSPHSKVVKSYRNAAEKCRKVIADYPDASDLWIVRNRLIVALLGMWKVEVDLKYLEVAIIESQNALAAGYPNGGDVIARYCIAQGELRKAKGNTDEIIAKLSSTVLDGKESGHVLAASALLALSVAERGDFKKYRKLILKKHTEYSMMWTFSAFLLDRSHHYWMFQMPFTAGWSFGRRESYFQTKGDVEEAERFLKTELTTLDGKVFRVPEDLDSEWTALIVGRSGPWSRKREDGLPASPLRLQQQLASSLSTRPDGEVSVKFVMLDGDVEGITSSFGKKGILSPVLQVKEGKQSSLLQRLGVLSDDTQMNSVLLRKDGRIVAMISGLAKQHGRNGNTLVNVLAGEDERWVIAKLKAGEVKEAEKRIMSLVPPYDPEAVDSRGRKLKKPRYHSYHLRARAHVYMSLKDWNKALADAQEVLKRQLGQDGGMSLRTKELDEAEILVETIKKQLSLNK